MFRFCWDTACRTVLSEAVDWCICFTRKIQHGCDRERSRPQGPKNVHNFLMTARPLSWACGHGTEMLLILKKLFLTWKLPDISDMTVQRNVSRFCTRSICGWNLFQPLGLGHGGPSRSGVCHDSRWGLPRHGLLVRWLYQGMSRSSGHTYRHHTIHGQSVACVCLQ